MKGLLYVSKYPIRLVDTGFRRILLGQKIDAIHYRNKMGYLILAANGSLPVSH
jgi:predicted aspartyl protease